MSLFTQLLIACPLLFFAGFVDSIAGGGGIISLPAMYAIGLNPQTAIGTNKFAAAIGTTITVRNFVKSKKYHLYSAVIASVFALIGAYGGSRLALIVDGKFLRIVMVVMLPLLAIFIFTNKRINNTETKITNNKKVLTFQCALTGLILGAYDGFFGPGTGTFLIIVFNTIIGFEVITASGNAKCVNWASNIASMVAFIPSGHVVYLIAIPGAICSILGNYFGSKLAIKGGAKVIKPAFGFVLVILLIKIIIDIL